MPVLGRQQRVAGHCTAMGAGSELAAWRAWSTCAASGQVARVQQNARTIADWRRVAAGQLCEAFRGLQQVSAAGSVPALLHKVHKVQVLVVLTCTLLLLRLLCCSSC